jgi:CBS domain-containing protein
MNLDQELRTEQVTHLNLSGFCQVVSGTKVSEVLNQMRREGHNVCLIINGDDLVGIFTDRDVLRKVATVPATWDRPIDEVMTPAPITAKPSTSAAEALWLMDEKHFRNLPIVGEDGEMVGNMTYQAINNYLAARNPIDVLNQPPRPEHFPRKAEGG